MGLTQTFADSLLRTVAANAAAARVFGEIQSGAAMLRCKALSSAEEAWYRLERDADHWFVSLVTPDRWLSESIEADLMHHGDPIEELVHEELVELDYDGPALTIKHYRSDDMLYTFRSPIPVREGDVEQSADVATKCLLAYETAFRELGDMNVDDEA